jgi:hypothetical protein
VIGVRILFVHDLDIELPPGKFAPVDGFVKVPLIALTIARDDLSRLSVRQVLNALLRFEGKLHPKSLVLGVDEAVGVAPEPMHMAERLRDSAITHDNGDPVQRLRKVRPEIPVAVRAPHARPRITFDRVVEIRELERIAQEEDRGVVTHKVPVALVCCHAALKWRKMRFWVQIPAECEPGLALRRPLNATAHKLARVVYHVLHSKEPYTEIVLGDFNSVSHN